MIEVSERLRDLLGFGVLLVLLVVLLVVPHEIPKEIQGDFPAEIYPRTLLGVGVVLLGLQIAVTLARGKGAAVTVEARQLARTRSEEQPSELQSLMRISYAVFCLKKKQDTQLVR